MDVPDVPFENLIISEALAFRERKARARPDRHPISPRIGGVVRYQISTERERQRLQVAKLRVAWDRGAVRLFTYRVQRAYV